MNKPRIFPKSQKIERLIFKTRKLSKLFISMFICIFMQSDLFRSRLGRHEA